MNYTEFRKHLEIERVSKPMIEAATTAFSALFEGLNPAQKTRRAIRQFMEEPPGGWDSVAMNEKEEPFISQHGNEMSWAMVLESYIRGEFFHRRGMPDRYEPGIARIALLDMGLWPENLYDYRSNKPEPKDDLIPDVRRIVGLLSGEAHINDFSFDLDGMNLDELLARFGSRTGESTSTDMVDTGHTNYRVVHIESFAQSQQYSHFFDSNPNDRWCIIEDNGYWNRYTKNGRNTAYYLIAPGAEDMTAKVGENCPKDEYGLSLIGIMIGLRGTLEHCCVRWNYSHGASDHELDVEELEELLGRPLSVLCPPKAKITGTAESFSHLMGEISSGRNPMDVYRENGGKIHELGFDNKWDEYRMVSVHLEKADLEILVNASDGLPVYDLEGYEPTAVEVLDNEAIRLTFTLEDEWGYSEFAYVLVGHGGNAKLIGGSTEDSYGYQFMDTVEGTELSGVYEVRLNDQDDDTFLIDISGSKITAMHADIDICPEEGIIICDENVEPKEEYWEEEYDPADTEYANGQPEVLAYNRETKKITRLVSPGLCPGLTFIECVYPTQGHVIVAYNVGNNLMVIRNGRPEKICEFESRDYGHEHHFDGDKVLVLEMEDGSYSIFSVMRCEFIATDLDEPPAKGIYRRRGDQFAEVYWKDGPILDGKYTDIKPVPHMETPWVRSHYHGYYSSFGEEVFECTDSNGDVYLINMDTLKPIYDRPVPRGSFPYSDEAIVMKTGDNTLPYVIADTDGTPRTPKFTKLSYMYSGTQPTIFGCKDKHINEADWMIFVDRTTGKPISPTLSGSRVLCSEDWSDGVYQVRTLEGKFSIYKVRKTTTDGKPVHQLVQSNIGWVDSLHVVKPTNIAIVSDGARKFLYDVINEKELDWEPSLESLRSHLARFAEKYDAKNGTNVQRKMKDNDWAEMYVGAFISNNPNWALEE
jgi:hypothetical protein